jgi:hypothetical protein
MEDLAKNYMENDDDWQTSWNQRCWIGTTTT